MFFRCHIRKVPLLGLSVNVVNLNLKWLLVLAVCSVYVTGKYGVHKTWKYMITCLNFKWTQMSRLEDLFISNYCLINTYMCISNRYRCFYFNLMNAYSDVHITIHGQHIQCTHSIHIHISHMHIYQAYTYITPNIWIGYTYIYTYITCVHHSHSPSSMNWYQTQIHIYYSHSPSSINGFKT